MTTVVIPSALLGPSMFIREKEPQLVAAGVELRRAIVLEFDESKHPRVPAGSPGGGEFGSGGGTKTEDSGSHGDGLPHPPTTERGLRDQLVESWKGHFLNDLGDYPARFDAARAAGQRTPTSETSAQDKYWRDRMGYSTSWDKYDHALVRAFVDGDKRALGTVRTRATQVARESKIGDVRPVYAEAAKQAIDQVNADPRMRSLMDQYGAPSMALGAVVHGAALDSLDTPSANYSESNKVITMFDNAFTRTDGDKAPDLPATFKPGGSTVSEGLVGILTHEFGHHVENSLTDEQRNEWRSIYTPAKTAYEAAYAATPSGTSGEAIDAREAVGRQTVSYYSFNSFGGQVTYEKEGFAETFAAVMHPDYSRDQFDPAVHPMLEWMENLTAKARAAT